MKVLRITHQNNQAGRAQPIWVWPWLSAVILLMAASFASLAGAQTHATAALRPQTPIAKISYAGGYLAQDLDAFGLWTEYKSNGEVNYTFAEAIQNSPPHSETPEGAAPSSFDLIGAAGKVTLRINPQAKTISGEWPNHPMAVIHKITAIDGIVFTQTSPENPAPEIPESVTPAPVSPAPINPVPEIMAPAPIYPGSSSRPDRSSSAQSRPNTGPFLAPRPEQINAARYKTGMFEKTAPTAWVERTDDGRVFNFQQIGLDPTRLYLHDALRQVFVILEPAARRSFIAEQGQGLREMYALTDFSIEPQIDRPSAPSPPPPYTPRPDIADRPGALTPAQRTDCLKSGGVVERAGLLGAERCTIRYDDAGMICADSVNCQGQCRASGNPAIGEQATGVCQANNNPFGCYAEIKNGRAEPMLCVD